MNTETVERSNVSGPSAVERRVGRRIKTWVRPLAKMPMWQAVDWVLESKPRALRNAVVAMEMCTQTNCWWGDYNAARALLPIARERLPANTEVTGRR